MTPNSRRKRALITFYSLIGAALSLSGPVARGQQASIGINLAGDWLWADAVRQARPHWDTAADLGDGAATEDSNDWPTEDCSLLVWEGHAYNEGTYALSFHGKATISVSYGYGTVNGASSSTGTYDASTNTTTATVVITDTSTQNCSLIFTGTRRTAASATNTGITNVHLYRPVSEGASSSFGAGTLFTSQTLAMSGKFAVTRFMDLVGANNSTQAHWSDRPLPGAWNQSPIAYEYVVAYGNAASTDIYINLPLGADRTYVTNLANLIRYGSDGVNPYTTAQANPIYAPLHAGLHVYLENSNEVWNGGFQQFHDNYNAVVTDQSANNAEWAILNFDGAAAGNLYTGAWRRIAYHAKIISDAFRAVWGDAAMPPNADATVRPLLEFQAGDGQATGSTQLQFLDSFFNNSDGVNHVSMPHPVNYFLWGGGGATYYTSNDDTAATVDALFGSGIPNMGYGATTQTDTALVKGYGLKRVAYEGGWSVYNGNNGYASTAGTAAALAKFDDRATTAQTTAQTIFEQSGGDLNIFYTSSSWAPTYIWSLTDQIFNLSTPLFQAVSNLDAAVAPVVTLGNVISATAPTTLAYGSQLFSENNYNSGLPDNGALGFVPLVTGAGAYQISLNINTGSAGHFVRVLVDGQTLGSGPISVPVSSSPVSVVVGTIRLTPGQHGLIVAGQYTSNNDYTDNSCGFTSVTLAPAMPVITSVGTANGTEGQTFSYQITATGNPTSYGVQGLPSGLTINSKTGLLTGTPRGAGTFQLTLNAYNTAGKGSAALVLTIKGAAPVITSAATAVATVAKSFRYQITATNDPTSYGVQGLTDGLTVDASTGIISGTPKTAGKLTLTLNCYNSAGRGSATLTVTVAQ